LTCMRRAASILSSRDKWRPADVPLQAVGVASLATLFIGLWCDRYIGSRRLEWADSSQA